MPDITITQDKSIKKIAAQEAHLQDKVDIASKPSICERIYNLVTMQKRSLVLWLPVFIALGIGAYFSIHFEPPVSFSIVGVVASFFLLSCFYTTRERSYQGFIGWIISIAIFSFVLGFASAQLRVYISASPMLERDIRVTHVSGVVHSIENLDQEGARRVILNTLDIEDLSPDQTPKSIRIKFRDLGDVHVGDYIDFTAGLNAPSAPAIPGGFDFQRYAFFKGIGAFGFSYGRPEILKRHQPQGIEQHLGHIRQKIKARIERVLPQSNGVSILSTLMTGERSAINKDDMDAIRRSGLAHLLAISGLHVGMITAFIFFGVRLALACIAPLALNYPIKRYAALISMVGACAYVLIVGAAVPAIRALIMTFIVLFGVLLDRMPISMRLVAISASIILLFMPEVLLSASFQMSFSAVAGLVVFYEMSRNLWVRAYREAGFFRRVMIYFLGICVTTLVASIATAPFVLFHFQQLALHNSLLSNLIAVPVMSIAVMPSCVIAFLLMPLHLDAFFLQIAAHGIEIILYIAHDLSAWDHAVWTPPSYPLSALVLMVVAVMAVYLLTWPARLVSAPLILLAFAVMITHRSPDVLISSTGKTIAFSDEDGRLWVSSRRSERFTSDQWIKAAGQDIKDPGLWSGYTNKDNLLSCGELGCHLGLYDYQIAVSDHPSGLKEDCSRADIVIARYPMRKGRCTNAVSIDKYDLKDEGVYAIYLDQAHKRDPVIKTVAQSRGQRPWVIDTRYKP